MVKRVAWASVLSVLLLVGCGGGEKLGQGDGEDGGSSGGDGNGTPQEPVANSYRVGSMAGGSFVNKALAIGQANLAARGSSSLSFDVVDADGELAVGVAATVQFSSDCISRGQASVSATPNSTSTGSLTTTYTANGCSGDDLVTAYVTVDGKMLTATGTISVQPAQFGSLEYLKAEPAIIGMSGSPLPAQSSVSFRVLDSSGQPLPNRTVEFALTTPVGGIVLLPASAKSDVGGVVRATVQAGSVHTSARVRATTVNPQSGQTITTQSEELVVTTGLLDQNSFSLSAQRLALDGDCDGDFTTVTIRAADRYNNPAPKGTAITFTTEGGKIGGQCLTGDPFAGEASEAGVCSVRLNVQNPRAANGHVTVLATALGEESFAEANGNGFRDEGESFFDLPEAFLDSNENGVRDADESFSDFNSNGAYDPGNGSFDGYVCDLPGVNCRSNLADVRDSLVVVFSRIASAPTVTGVADSISVGLNQTIPLSFTITDDNGNSLPTGTTYKLETNVGSIVGGSTVGPLNTLGANVAAFLLKGPANADSGTVTLTMSLPEAACGKRSFTKNYAVYAPGSTGG